MEIVIAALIASVPATIAATGAWRSTVKMNKTANGTTSGEYVEQTNMLVKVLSRQMEDHMVNDRIHNKVVA